MTRVAEAIRRVITFDGPAASGKSSVAVRVAERLGVPFVSSGLLYRAAAHLVLRSGADAADPRQVLRVVRAADVALEPRAEGNRVLVDGEDVTARLHTDDVDATVSQVAAHPELRAWVNARLRELEGPFVIDGRDMGSVVFPDAVSKFYLTAPPEVRAARRVGERPSELGQVAEAIRRRDQQDARQLAPAEDACTIDTGALDLEQVVRTVLDRLEGVPLR